MNMLLDWYRKYFGTPEQPTIYPEFDVMRIPLPGDYAGEIEEAEVYYGKNSPHVGVRLKIRLVPDDPEDQQTAGLFLSRRRYVELLQRLGLKRTNDVTVLKGHIIPVRVADSFVPNGVRTDLLEDICPPKQPHLKKPSRRKSSKTPSRRTGSA